MKRFLCMLLLAVPCAASAITLGEDARREANLYNAFIRALYAQQNEDSRAFELFEEALSYAPDSNYLKRYLVAAAIMQDRFSEAEKYADFIDENSDGDDWTVRAAYLLKKHRVPEALTAYETALSKSPEDARIAYQYMLLLSYVGDWDALGKMEDLAERFPAMAPSVYLEIGKARWRAKDPQQALAYYDKAGAADPFFLEAYLARAEVYERTSNFFFMLREYEKLEKMGYKSADMYARMGSVFLLSKDDAEAEKYFRKAVLLEPGDPNSRYFLTVLAEKKEDWAQALAHLQAARDYADTSGKWLQASFYQQKMGNEAAGLKTLRDAYKKFQGSVEIGYFYALALQDAGKTRRAARVLKKIVTERPEYADARLAYAYTLETLRDYKGMEEQIIALLAQNEDFDPALNLWAYSLAVRGVRLDEAQKYAEKAVSLSPQDGSYQDTLAWVYYRRGQFDRALDLLTGIAPETVRDNPEIAYHLGAVYAALGRSREARKYLEAAQAEWKEAARLLKELPADE